MDDILLYQIAEGALYVVAAVLGSLIVGMCFGALIRKGGRDDD